MKNVRFDNDKYFATLKELNEMIPYTAYRFINSTIAGGFAQGREAEMNDNWVRNMLMTFAIDQDMIDYDEAVALRPKYDEAIAKIAKMYK